jgi:hypothetical protein
MREKSISPARHVAKGINGPIDVRWMTHVYASFNALPLFVCAFVSRTVTSRRPSATMTPPSTQRGMDEPTNVSPPVLESIETEPQHPFRAVSR